MAEPEYVVVYAVTYPSVAAARAVLDTIGQLNKEVAGRYDAAVADQALTGTAKVFKREMEATIDQITGELQEAFKG